MLIANTYCFPQKEWQDSTLQAGVSLLKRRVCHWSLTGEQKSLHGAPNAPLVGQKITHHAAARCFGRCAPLFNTFLMDVLQSAHVSL